MINVNHTEGNESLEAIIIKNSIMFIDLYLIV